MAADLENDGEAGGLGASLESFKEVDEVVGIIQDLEDTIKDEQKHEVAVERFRLVLDWYQEQPHLLDPHLERLLELLVVQIRREEATAPLLHATATLAAHIFKVRGPKVVVKYLPHEVADLERVIAVLQVSFLSNAGCRQSLAFFSHRRRILQIQALGRPVTYFSFGSLSLP